MSCHADRTVVRAVDSDAHLSRRGWVKVTGLGSASLLLGAGFAVAGLSGCGFALRRAPTFAFKSIALVGFRPASPLAQALQDAVAASSATLSAPGAAALPDVRLEAVSEGREKRAVASTAAGQVRELQLQARLTFRLRTPAGVTLIPDTEIRLSRDMSYRESAALGKEQEEALLYRAMEDDIVGQVMRRLATVRLP